MYLLCLQKSAVFHNVGNIYGNNGILEMFAGRSFYPVAVISLYLLSTLLGHLGFNTLP